MTDNWAPGRTIWKDCRYSSLFNKDIVSKGYLLEQDSLPIVAP